MKLNKTYPITSFKALEDEGPGKFEAVVSVFGNVDYQGDRVMPGAFKNTLTKWQMKGDPIPVIWSHDWLNPDAHIGFVDPSDAIELIDEERKSSSGIPTGGLLVRGHIDVHKPFAAQVFDLLKDRRVKEWSFAYDVDREKVGEDGANELQELSLLEVGPCLKGANPETYTVSAKSVLETELREAYDLQRHVARMATWKDADPEVLEMLSKSYGISKYSRPLPKLFHVERRIPSYDGPYSLEASDTFVCIDDEKAEVLDSHKSYEAAADHVEMLKKNEHLTDEEIAQVISEEDGEKAEGKPWHIEKQGDEFCVIKDDDGAVEGCHETREDALAQLRALYASEAASAAADDEKAADDDEESSSEKVQELAEALYFLASAKSTVTDEVLEREELLGTTTDTATSGNLFSHVHYSTLTTDGDGTTTNSFTAPIEGLKIGRVIGRTAATALKEQLITAIDEFVKSVNDRAEEEDDDDDDDEKTATVEAKKEESPTEYLDRLLGEQQGGTET